MNKVVLSIIVFFAYAFSLQMGGGEVRASIMGPEMDFVAVEFIAPVDAQDSISSEDAQTPPEVIPTDGIPPIRCLCGTLGTNFSTSTTSSSAAASCLDSLLEIPTFDANQDELLPGHVAPVPPKPPVFEQLKVPIA